MIRAYCYPSGLIEFGHGVPKGATVIARGPDQQLRDFIGLKARLVIGGRRRRMPGTKQLYVPGVPEADNQIVAERALNQWIGWITAHAPKGIRVLPR
jgi:hypothetical protein